MHTKASIAAIITAAGASSRMGKKKEYCPLANETDTDGKPLTVLGKTALAFAACPRISTLVITVPPDPAFGETAARNSLPARLLRMQDRPGIHFVFGGDSRRTSVHKALSLLKECVPQPDYVLIHDGARPWVDSALVNRVIDAMLKHGTAIPLLPLTDTPKEIDKNGLIVRHLQRDLVGNAQTPQGFAFSQILRAHEKAAKKEKQGRVYTDDAQVWGEFIGRVFTVPGSPLNKKITYPEDLIFNPAFRI